MRINVERTRTGLPALWENGGGLTNRGHSQLIGDSVGGKKSAIYVARGGHLACGNHVLLVIEVGDIIVRASHSRGDFDIDIYRVIAIDDEGAELEGVADFRQGEWQGDYEKFCDIVDTAKSKARDYHCRSGYWYESPKDYRC